eukprot:CAMPEP_0204162230 /NCGR_PEP_ID=MMETSP0361-20130328/35387_1 /ASSEMBLY_ACC=CAM_ASM_000343 /TAXON_ID=268821 /ORGANISM="Scrippsiella Hangoei, Strain SHTV-5" /LENGTH=182 /DNA_ID=CAMNT_0051118793 /DNA_START=82 /DNA_END=630 /DNA_ORIENTATION=+
MPQPNGPNICKGKLLSTTTVLRSVVMACLANADWPNHRAPRGSPFSSTATCEPSSERPDMLRAMKCWQYALRPLWQLWHAPHESKVSTTWSPTRTRVTELPTTSTTPDPSCPVMIGNLAGPGSRTNMSVWQKPQPSINTNNSSSRSSRKVTCSSWYLPIGDRRTAAVVLVMSPTRRATSAFA